MISERNPKRGGQMVLDGQGGPKKKRKKPRHPWGAIAYSGKGEKQESCGRIGNWTLDGKED